MIMTFQQPKKKRGRPRKNAVGFDTSLNNLTTMHKDINSFNNSQAEAPKYPKKESFKPEIEDWERELDGEPNQANLSRSELNNTLISSDLEMEDKREPIDDKPVELKNVFLDISSECVEKTVSQDASVLLDKVEEKFKQPTKIHIIDGEKGGAGKSFVSRALIEYCAFSELNMAIVDADTSNQDIAKLYDGVESAFFSDDEKQVKYADKIFYLAFERSVIVNLPAQVYTNVTNWITRNNLIDLGKEHSISFIKWFVCTGSVDSVNFFLKSLNDLGNDVTHIFVRNLGLCDDWKYIDSMPEFEAAQAKYKFMIIDFPKFSFWERNTIDRLGITFEQALLHPELKVVSRQRVKNSLREAYTAFNLTRLL
jgi:hypothetical protein